MADIAMDASSERSPLADSPPKPHKTHRRSKIGSDPFLDLDNDALKQSSSLAPGKQESDSSGESTSLLMDLVLTPLNMITFILSLTMIDYKQRQWRLSQHASGQQETFWFRLMHWSWLHPEPYQDSQDGTWKHNDKASLQNTPTSTFRGWHTRKKHRAMAKMEINDAFDSRGRVLVALLAWAVLGVAGLSYAATRMYGYTFGS